MSVSEMIRVILFVGTVLLVYLMAAVMTFRRVIAQFTTPPLAPGRGYLCVYRTVIGLATVGALCIAYGYFVEPHWPETNIVRMETSKLPKGTPLMRIVHISDLHSDAKPRLEERLPNLVAAEKPDLIVFTGDAINSSAALPLFKRCLRELAALAPTFVVRGNWDMEYWHNPHLFDDTGVRELDGEAVKIGIKGAEIWVAGAPFGLEERIGKTLASVPQGAFVVFLYHSPDAIDALPRDRVDLYCAGHTHGGQVALPFYGALVTYSKFGKKYESGLYRVDGTWLYVNRGLGLSRWPPLPVRFCARPEITVIEVVSAR